MLPANEILFIICLQHKSTTVLILCNTVCGIQWSTINCNDLMKWNISNRIKIYLFGFSNKPKYYDIKIVYKIKE